MKWAAVASIALLSLCLTHDLAGGVDSPADGTLIPWVNQRVAERQPTAVDRRFDEIAWVADIRTAQRLAKEHNRPVFLFTHDGRMNLGRC
jgi:hypothetical protein